MTGKKKGAVDPGATVEQGAELIPHDSVGQGDPLFVLGEELTASELELVDDAVRHINAVTNRSAVELAAEISTYVIERFFDGDYQAFLDPNRHKLRSFTALCQRPELTVSQATLYALVRVGHQLEEIPLATARALSTKHHRALLALDDPATKSALAHQAVAEGWSAATLEANVRAARGTQSKTGRPPLPPFVKSFRAIQRSLDTDGNIASSLRTLSASQRRELEGTLGQLEKRIAKVRTALSKLPEPDA